MVFVGVRLPYTHKLLKDVGTNFCQRISFELSDFKLKQLKMRS